MHTISNRLRVYETNTLRLSTVQAGTASPYENLQKLSYTYDNAGNLTLPIRNRLILIA